MRTAVDYRLEVFGELAQFTRGLIQVGVNVTVPGKKKPSASVPVAGPRAAAGARPVYKCTHVRVVFCFEVLIFLSFIDHLLAKARQQAELP